MRVQSKTRQRQMWTLPLDMVLKQQSPIKAYGLASRNSPTYTHIHTHTHTLIHIHTQLSLAQAMCQTIVAKSAACNKRWKELEKWKWWFNAVIKTGAQRALTEWKPIQTDLMLRGISSPPRPPVCGTQKCKQKSTVLSLSFSTHSYTLTHPSVCAQPVWLPTFKIQYLIAMSPLVIGVCLQAIIPESNV